MAWGEYRQLAEPRRESLMVFRYLMSLALLMVISMVDNADAAKPGPKDEDAPDEFSKTDSGLEYRILRKSDGKKPRKKDKVTVHYEGWLDDKTVFDSSYKRDETTSFPLDGVIPGWTEGLQLVGEGGMIQLRIPSDLGYGPNGRPGTIPGGATLHFLVELKRVH
jgi:FKBP-type peptidyl-prolyl cis-trans isomerase FkpA